MGILQQTVSSITDAFKFSFSTWVYITAADAELYGGSYLLEFGEDGGSGNSVVELRSGSGWGYDSINCFFSRSGRDSRYIEDDSESVTGAIASMSFHSPHAPVGSLSGGWVHVFVSVDMQNYFFFARPSTGVYAYLPLMKLWINGVSRLQLTDTDEDPPITFRVGSDQAFIGMNGVDPPTDAGGTQLGPYAIPWQFNPNGFPCGQPLAEPHATDFGDHSPVRFAETQAWFGTYIDPAVHIRKFITVTGRPVDASVPLGTFGAPSISWVRNGETDTEYENNGGSGGSFTKTGTITDFTPSPWV